MRTTKTPAAPGPRVADAIEDLGPLDGVADSLGRAASHLRERPALAHALQGAGLGHPLHPALVHFPIGFAVAALVSDVVGGRYADDVTRALTRLTFLSAVPAALTGLADADRVRGERPRRLVAAHALVNSKGTLLAFVSCLARTSGHHGWARLLLAGSVVSYSAGGFFGGLLVYREKAGVQD